MSCQLPLPTPPLRHQMLCCCMLQRHIWGAGSLQQHVLGGSRRRLRAAAVCRGRILDGVGGPNAHVYPHFCRCPQTCWYAGARRENRTTCCEPSRSKTRGNPVPKGWRIACMILSDAFHPVVGCHPTRARRPLQITPGPAGAAATGAPRQPHARSRPPAAAPMPPRRIRS